VAVGDLCLLIYPHKSGQSTILRDPEARLAEGAGLAQAIGLEITHAEVVNLGKPRPATLFGKGTIERLGRIATGGGGGAKQASLVFVDAILTPIQQRNLERAWQCKVIDRTGLILEIFGARARTREGRLQVELAALSYQRGRLVRSWTHLERQRGGAGFMGGPGETQIESDRRLIDQRITKLKRELNDVKRTRGLHRAARRRVPYPVIALVGYTNAGKSTLFNRLTHAQVEVRDQLFATLDPTMRKVELPSGRLAILSDTVGFISDLPHELVNAFHATLEEVMEADIIVHVRDIAHPDNEAQKSDVLSVLTELGLSESLERNLIEVLNKIDLLSTAEREIVVNRAKRSNVPVVILSATTGEGSRGLLDLFDRQIAAGFETITVELKHSDGATLAWLYEHSEVIERRDEADAIHMQVRMPSADVARFNQRSG
jgi:GTP-binding protein HflX